jgi:type II secretory pathway pseudopilin PulG
MFKCRHLRGTGGFTLIELVVVLLVVMLLGSALLHGPRHGSPRDVHAAAQLVRAEMRRAIARADAIQGEAVFYIDPSVVGPSRGGFTALAGPEGTTRDTLSGTSAAAARSGLLNGAQWGSGNATTAPDGGSPLQIPGTIRCRVGRPCTINGKDRVVLYLTHARNPDAVDAVVLWSDLTVHLLHFQPGTGRWISELR